MLEHPPVTIARGQGVYVYSATGKEYLDAIGSWWVSLLGHNNPAIMNAIRDQLDKIDHILMAGFVSDTTVTLARLLSNVLPPDLPKFFFSDNGSTAVEVALKIAMQYHALRGTQKMRFVSLEAGYHGDTLGAMSVGAIPMYHNLFQVNPHDRLIAHSPYCYRCPVGKDVASCKAECMDSLEMIFKRHHDSIAACIYEPMVQGAAGMRVYPPKVLSRIVGLCKQYHVLAIADEVAMGFCRTGKFWASQHISEMPDMLCCAKGLTGGVVPMALTAVSQGIYEEFKGTFPDDRIFQHGHSFTGNPIASAAAVATLTILTEEHYPTCKDVLCAYFAQALQKCADLACVGDIRCVGMVGALELVADRITLQPFPRQDRIPMRIMYKAHELGVLIRPIGNVLYFIPALTITPAHIDIMIALTMEAISSVVYA